MQDNQEQNFDTYYNKKLLPILRENDKIRQRYLLSFWILALMAIIFYPLVIWIILNNYLQEQRNIIGFILGLSCIIIALLYGPIYFYKKKVKPLILPKIAEFFGQFSYKYEAKIPDTILRSSDLFSSFDESKGDDYFNGKYQDVEICLAEEKLYKHIYSKKGEEKNIRIFYGICILLEMNKKFQGHIVVKNKQNIVLNFLNQFGKLKKVYLEDVEFNKIFDVWADNQIESRYLLTTAFMERILKLKQVYNGKSIQFSFKDNQLLLAIETKQNMFEANSFFTSNINQAKIKLVFKQFKTILSIIEILKLNQRIGM